MLMKQKQNASFFKFCHISVFKNSLKIILDLHPDPDSQHKLITCLFFNHTAELSTKVC